MALRSGVRALVATVLVTLCTLADADELSDLVIRSTPLKKPECRDPPPLDPVANLESLPTHERITEYLSDQRSPTRFACISATLRYEGPATRKASAWSRSTRREVHSTPKPTRRAKPRSAAVFGSTASCACSAVTEVCRR